MIAASMAARSCTRKLRDLADRYGSALARWRNESRNRHALAVMNERVLRDIGLSRAEVTVRTAKWRLIRHDG